MIQRPFGLRFLSAILLLACWASPAGANEVTTASSSMSREDPLVGFNFLVEINGVSLGAFDEVTGIGSDTEVVEFRDGGDAGTVLSLPGPIRYPQVTLKRGITSNLDTWNWRQQFVADTSLRFDVVVYLLGPAGGEIAVWNFSRAWPVKVSGPTPKSDGNNVAIEELTIAHEGFTRLR